MWMKQCVVFWALAHRLSLFPWNEADGKAKNGSSPEKMCPTEINFQMPHGRYTYHMALASLKAASVLILIFLKFLGSQIRQNHPLSRNAVSPGNLYKTSHSLQPMEFLRVTSHCNAPGFIFAIRLLHHERPGWKGTATGCMYMCLRPFMRSWVYDFFDCTNVARV